MKKKLLIVEDALRWIEIYQENFDAKYQTFYEDNLKSAIENASKVSKNFYNACICDRSFPKDSENFEEGPYGIDFYNFMQKNHPETKFIFMAGDESFIKSMKQKDVLAFDKEYEDLQKMIEIINEIP
jgi:DNA-binding NtrC family response regulator